MKKNILELKFNNRNKELESHLKPKWSWKTLVSIVLFCSILANSVFSGIMESSSISNPVKQKLRISVKSSKRSLN